jgi:hypothetical protein
MSADADGGQKKHNQTKKYFAPALLRHLPCGAGPARPAASESTPLSLRWLATHFRKHSHFLFVKETNGLNN